MIFISETPNPPFKTSDIVTMATVTPQTAGLVDGEFNILYIIVKEECVDLLEVRVEGDDVRGSSLFISKADTLNFEWTKKLTYKDIQVPIGYIHIPIACKWKFLLDEKINKGYGRGRINIYKLPKKC